MIVYQHGFGVAVVRPCECGLTVEQIGAKDVPSGVPFWIVQDDAIPVDRSMRDAWQLDIEALGEPAGYGGAL